MNRKIFILEAEKTKRAKGLCRLLESAVGSVELGLSVEVELVDDSAIREAKPDRDGDVLLLHGSDQSVFEDLLDKARRVVLYAGAVPQAVGSWRSMQKPLPRDDEPVFAPGELEEFIQWCGGTGCGTLPRILRSDFLEREAACVSIDVCVSVVDWLLSDDRRLQSLGQAGITMVSRYIKGLRQERDGRLDQNGRGKLRNLELKVAASADALATRQRKTGPAGQLEVGE